MSCARPSGTQSRERPDASDALTQFASDVQYYLMQDPRQLPSRYLYDALGSALFDAICRLPWYPITRAEGRLLAKYAADVLRLTAAATTIAELGPGNGEKLRTLLEAADPSGDRVNVHLVDLSAAALESAARILAKPGHIAVRQHEASYEEGLRDVAAERSPVDPMLLLFLGSNIGNFDPPGANAFLYSVRRQLRTGDWLLMGADLVKSERQLRLAYDDPLGVTAAFNRNLLVRINRELGGNFDVDAFAHQAVWNVEQSRIEMHLVARRPQRIHIEASGVAFAMSRGDRIWTESSYKYRSDQIVNLLEGVGFRPAEQWIDDPDQFALTLVEAV